MKNSFTGYYSPTSEQYEKLWKEALFVLDTNVLLSLYRLPTLARDELIGLLELLKDRLWVPHQVGLEFQRGRLTVIANERKSTEDALSAAQNVVGQVKNKVEGLQIDKRGLGIESKPLLDELERSNQRLIDAITAIHNSQLDVSSTDIVRQKLDNLLDGRIGKAPSTQEELDSMVSDGEYRFNNKIPPGFADVDKDKNPNDSSFIFDHIKYQRKFGDLILWKQLLEHVKESNTVKVLFITADRKEDWWWREQGKTIGPHPELMREIKRVGGVELFWMYSSVQFVEHANKYSKASVSTESVAEIEQATQYNIDHIYPLDYASAAEMGIRNLHLQGTSIHTDDYRQYEHDQIFYWLARTIPNLEINRESPPDFIASTPRGLHGFIVSRSINVTSGARTIRPTTRIRKAAHKVLEGELAALTIIFVLDSDEVDYLMRQQGMLLLREKVASLIKSHPISEVFVGQLSNGEFHLILHNRGNPRRFNVNAEDPNV